MRSPFLTLLITGVNRTSFIVLIRIQSTMQVITLTVTSVVRVRFMYVLPPTKKKHMKPTKINCHDRCVQPGNYEIDTNKQ